MPLPFWFQETFEISFELWPEPANIPPGEDIGYTSGANLDVFGGQDFQIVSFVFFRFLNFGKDNSAFFGKAQFGISEWSPAPINQPQKTEGDKIPFMLLKGHPGAGITIGNPTGSPSL